MLGMGSRLNNFIRWILYEQPTMARMTLNREFQRLVPEVKKGKVLEIGAGKYNNQRDKIDNGGQYFSFNLLFSEEPDISGDASYMPIKENCIDSIVMLEVLEHIVTPSLVIQECHRVLKPGGTIICSTRFICPQHGAPHDYFRYTSDSIKILFRSFRACKIIKLGSRLHVLIDIASENFSFMRLFNRLFLLFSASSASCYSGLILIAKK